MITVSIVVHKTPFSQLSKALSSLLASEVEKIYIVDNSPDYGLKKCSEISDKISYIHMENKGFGAGHNLAIRKAMKKNPDYHLVMNADVYWEGDILSSLAEFMDNNPDVGLVSPKVFYPDGDLQYSCRQLPTPVDLFFKRFLPEKFSEKRMRKYLLENHDHDLPLNCPYLLGSFLFFRMDALKNKGLFDERFFMYPEDIDITRRLHQNWKTVYWPEVSIVHEHQAASRKNLKMLRIHMINMIRYFNKWGWVFDKQRKQYNRILNKSLVGLPKGKEQKGRG